LSAAPVRANIVSVDAEFERAQWDYEQTVAGIWSLTDIRFKLLAFVPTLSGAAIALLTRSGMGDGTKGALAALGFFVTLGIVVYDQRNSQLYYTLIDRAIWLEGSVLRLPTWEPRLPRGGMFAARPHGSRLFGCVTVSHSRGLGLVYSAVLGAWAFPIAHLWLGAPAAGAIAAVVGLVFLYEQERLLQSTRKSRLPAAQLVRMPPIVS
jgi:hypothetical protein